MGTGDKGAGEAENDDELGRNGKGRYEDVSENNELDGGLGVLLDEESNVEVKKPLFLFAGE